MATIKHRRATKAQWSSVNPVLASGEIGLELDTNRIKIGNGFAEWSELTYFIDEATVSTMIGSGGGGGGTSVDDGDVSLSTTWSSKKISDGFDGKINESENRLVVVTEDGFMDAISGELVDIRQPIEEDDPITLQYALAMLYNMVVEQGYIHVETQRVFEGPLVAGVTPYSLGFVRNPDDIGFNAVDVLRLSLDTPSTSGPVQYRLGVSNQQDLYVGSTLWDIPEGETEVYYAPNHGESDVSRPTTYITGNTRGDFRLVFDIVSPGVGASGLTARVVRK